MNKWAVRVAGLFGFAVIQLTDMTGMPLFFVVSQIVAVRNPIPGENRPDAKAVVSTQAGNYAVREDPKTIADMIKRAEGA